MKMEVKVSMDDYTQELFDNFTRKACGVALDNEALKRQAYIAENKVKIVEAQCEHLLDEVHRLSILNNTLHELLIEKQVQINELEEAIAEIYDVEY